MLKRYNPDSTPDPKTWLRAGEEERLDLIVKAHRRLRVKLSDERSHALFHLSVEDQIALGDETPVAATLQRLRKEGLTRHDAIHAIASVLTEHLQAVLGGHLDPTAEPNEHYYQELGRLTARSWRQKYR